MPRDLQKARVVELSVVMAEILKLAETQTDSEIRQTLGNDYPDADILHAFQRFAEIEKQGLLFNRGENIQETFDTENRKPKLLIAIPRISIDSLFDTETLYAGTNMALSHMIQHLPKYADIHFTGKPKSKITRWYL